MSEAEKNLVDLLLVEDNALHVRLVTTMLEEGWAGGYRMTHVNRLDSAVDSVRRYPPACVLLDLVLPDASGLEAVHTIHSTAPDVPLVVISAHEDPVLAGQALREGAQDFLVKGEMTGDGLVRAVRFAIDRARSAPVPIPIKTRHEESAGTAVLNPDGGVIRADAGFGALLGTPAKDLVGAGASTYIDQDHLGTWLRSLQRQMDAVADTVRITTMLARSDETTVPVTADISMLRDGADAPAGFVVTVYGVSDAMTDEVTRALAAGAQPLPT